MALLQLDLFGEPLDVSPKETLKPSMEEEANINGKIDPSLQEGTLVVPVISDVKNVDTSTIKKKRKKTQRIFPPIEALNIPSEDYLKEKRYHSLTEVTKWFGLSLSQIRYWEKEISNFKLTKHANGTRYFRAEDIEILKSIYYLIKVKKFSIEGAKEYMKSSKQNIDAHLKLTESLVNLRNFLVELKDLLDKPSNIPLNK